MADHDPNPDTSIVGKDTDAAKIEQELAETTSESAGGNVSGTGDADAGEDLDIIFEYESDEDTDH